MLKVMQVVSASLLALLGLTAVMAEPPDRALERPLPPPQASPILPLPQPPGQSGADLFDQTCSACHGPYGFGIAYLGKDLVHSTFVRSLSDADLVNFLKRGRPLGDPQNTTGVSMPPKGGNERLDDKQLRSIVQYVRTLQNGRLAAK